MLALAGANLTDFSLKGFVEYFGEKQATCIMRHYEESIEKLRRTGVITIDEQEKVLEMQEKPAEPMSHWAVPPFYIYRAGDLDRIVKAVNEQVCNVDAPGDFIAWMCKHSEVYAYEMPGCRYDIGNLESCREIQEKYVGM